MTVRQPVIWREVRKGSRRRPGRYSPPPEKETPRVSPERRSTPVMTVPVHTPGSADLS